MLRQNAASTLMIPHNKTILSTDNRLLEMLADIPTLDPFLLREKAMQLDVAGEISSAYFNLTHDEWVKFQAPIPKRLMPWSARRWGDP